MLEIEIDGKKVEVTDGSTVMDAANKCGTYIPHFCYHKKLSIAANCRMCLVEVEKAPKPLPACATPVTNGMKVTTHSEKAVKAQTGVMEFLLINHPLDCPICDQGGECQLQDLAVGYGSSASRYQEEKRVVLNKNLGPLISTDMTRCIHCTRCVRFGQEIAGMMELGVANRGEHSEIMSFVGRTVDSEISGNMIDLCPVGALTSKPFRFSARTWEMSRRRSVSPHDSLGSNLAVQTKHDRVKRVLPLENEAINECWLSDKDRFSYEGLNSEDRLTRPMVKQGGVWGELDWQSAITYAANAIKGVVAEHGADSVGVLVSPHATLEEMYLAQKLARGIGSDHVEFRLRQSDFSVDLLRQGVPSLGMEISDLSSLDRVLVVGSFLRKDHPLFAQRLRQAAKRGTRVSLLGYSAEDPLMGTASNLAVAPSDLVATLAAVLQEVARVRMFAVEPETVELAANAENDTALSIARSLLDGERVALFLGNGVVQHPAFSRIWWIAQSICDGLSAHLGFLGEAANSVGGYIADAIPHRALATPGVFSVKRKAYLLVGAEPDLDGSDGAAAADALESADTVIALSAFGSVVSRYADLMLPAAPFSETSGTFINTEGRAQSFNAVVKPLGETRPAWKILRVLANALGLEGFSYESSESIKDEVLAGDIASRYSNRLKNAPAGRYLASGNKLDRVADVAIYGADPLVRRAEALQKTADVQSAKVRISPQTITELGLTGAKRVRVSMAGGKPVELDLLQDANLAPKCVRVSVGYGVTAGLGPMFGEIAVEPV